MSQDSHLQKAVLAELGWEPSVPAAHIGVAANAGVVTLSGHVESLAEKHAAETAALRVKGVKAVVDEIEVRLPDEIKLDDEEIAEAALDRLAWNVSLPAAAVKVTVEKGWITLTGEVDWRYQKEAAAQDLWPLVGVVGLTNAITLKPKVDVQVVSDDIVHALHRSWFFDPQTITVSADGGKVRLSGTVRSPHERQIAIATAWAEPGVTDVESDLTIV
jgi:osmotically-inducible protein OsmY